MSFGQWTLLSRCTRVFPAAPGVWQVRLKEGLLDYPTGRSAMIYYGASTNLRASVATFAARSPGEPWLARYYACSDHTQVLTQLLSRFQSRFGRLPRLPSEPV